MIEDIEEFLRRAKDLAKKKSLILDDEKKKNKTSMLKHDLKIEDAFLAIQGLRKESQRGGLMPDSNIPGGIVAEFIHPLYTGKVTVSWFTRISIITINGVDRGIVISFHEAEKYGKNR